MCVGRLILVAVTAHLCACTSAATPARPASERAASIDSQLPRLRVDTATVSDQSAEGAQLEAAYAADSLRRLHAVFYGETGRIAKTFYFDTSLFLVRQQSFRYDAPLSGRAVDSTMQLFDFSSPMITPVVADSLRVVVNELLKHMNASRQ